MKIRTLEDFPALAAGGQVPSDQLNEARHCEMLHTDRAAEITSKAETEGRDLLASELREVRRHSTAAQSLAMAIRKAEAEALNAAQARAFAATSTYGSAASVTDGTWLPSFRTWQSWQSESRAVGSSGNAFVPSVNASIYWDHLRARNVVLSAGPTVLDTVNYSLIVPRVAESATVGPVGENDEIIGSDPVIDGIVLTPRKFAALTRASNESLDDSTPQLRTVIADDLVRTMAGYLDAQMLFGSGLSGELTGLANVDGITTEAVDAVPTLDDFAGAIAALEAANGDVNRAAFFIAPRTWATLRTAKTLSDEYLLSAGDPTQATRPSIFGVPVFVSSHVPVDQGTGGDESTAILADMSQVLIARRKDVEIILDTSRFFEYDQTAIRVVSRVDMAVGNPEAVVTLTGLTA